MSRQRERCQGCTRGYSRKGGTSRKREGEKEGRREGGWDEGSEGGGAAQTSSRHICLADSISPQETQFLPPALLISSPPSLHLLHHHDAPLPAYRTFRNLPFFSALTTSQTDRGGRGGGRGEGREGGRALASCRSRSESYEKLTHHREAAASARKRRRVDEKAKEVGYLNRMGTKEERRREWG